VILHVPHRSPSRAAAGAFRPRAVIGARELPAHATPGTGRLTTRRRVRRVLDVVLAVLIFVAMAPLMALVAADVACTSPGPVIFKQVRLGRYGQPFVMYKFRTMYVDSDDRLHRDYIRRLLEEPAASTCDSEGLYKLVDDPRITPAGRLLRTLSLDELPQLFNVFRGDMSLVGPRPVLPWEAELFSRDHDKRFLVRPGLTGLWQISGRNRLTMTQALDLDVRYVDEQSLRLDLAILLRTIPVVLGRRGVR
jgi:lipopolysaccharide/colanic/teichoic acid biosynthesis glycosyltransferase